MSVIVTLRISGDPKRLEEYTGANADAMKAIIDQANEHGLIAHRFYGSDPDKIMVIDEWPDAESFQRFFEASGPQIGPLMGAAGVTSDPEITFWRKLNTNDDVGWES